LKTKMLNFLGVLTVSGSLVGAQLLLANETADFSKILAGTSIVEMPATAASLVAKADTQKGQKNVTIAVVKAAVRLNPTAAVAVVGAISHATPGMAPIAAVTAAMMQHKQLSSIAKAAAAAAPAQAGNIVAALIKEFPSSYAIIAIAASEGAPQAGKEILEVVADYVPALQAGINNAVSSYPSSTTQAQVIEAPAATPSSSLALPVQTILVQAVKQAPSPGIAIVSRPATQNSPVAGPPVIPAGGPILGPPFTPIVGPVTTISPSQTTPQTNGGRNYASP
jgi:hypothetical protein